MINEVDLLRPVMISRQTHSQDKDNFSSVCLTLLFYGYCQMLLINMYNIKDSTVILLQMVV
jgi:hypothetical protein